VTTGRETAVQDLIALGQAISEFRAALDTYQEIFHITLDILESGARSLLLSGMSAMPRSDPCWRRDLTVDRVAETVVATDARRWPGRLAEGGTEPLHSENSHFDLVQVGRYMPRGDGRAPRQRPAGDNIPPVMPCVPSRRVR